MNGFEPGATLFRRYRLERLLVAQAGVAVWEATDLHHERRVQLSLFEDGSTMLDHGRIDGGNFVVIEPPRAPRLELADAWFDDASYRVVAPRPSRAGRWAAAGLACGLAVGGLWFWHARPATSETTITSAPIVMPAATAPPPQPSAVPSAIPSAEPPPPPPPPPKRSKPKPPVSDTIRF